MTTDLFQVRKTYTKAKKEKKNVSELDAPTVVDSFGFNATEVNLVGAQIRQGVSAVFSSVMYLELCSVFRPHVSPL